MKVDEIKAAVRKRDGRCMECGIDWSSVKGPAGILMRQWLEEARRERKAVTA